MHKMSKEPNNNEVPIQALELLPWYALGLLARKEKEYVEQMLLEFPELQAHLKTEHEMGKYLKEEQEIFSLSAIEDRERRLAQLLTRDEFQPEKNNEQELLSSKLVSFMNNLFTGQMSKTQYMGFAAITTLSIALLFAFTVPLLESSSTFYPAAIESDDAKQNTNTVLVGLNVEPNDPRLLKILKSHGVMTTTIAGKDGMYRLSFTKEPSALDLDELLSALSKQTELIWFVGEAY
jgi:hypothetical protein